MKIVIYNTVKEFIESNENILLEREAITQLILFNSFINKDKTVSKEMLFGRVEDDNGDLNIIFCNVTPHNLLICDLKENTGEAVKVLADYLLDSEISIKGVNANKKICDEFISCYSVISGCEFKEYLAMDVMELREINKDISLPKGSFREATWNDLNIIADWYIKFVKEALNEDMTYGDFKDKIAMRIENKCIYLFEDENHTPVSMAATTRQLVNGVSVSLVYSNSQERGKGYGLAVVYYLSKLYLERGNKFCSLFVDKHNPTSNGVYSKIGYKILKDNFDYRIV
ncbi:GNAT family N-acetyltransferase [Clostridium sp.]|uniref:GNAT family N-acetyltransferase n=1 Tax=Clostridium sp. TaxID=1506 RepID=UPI0032179C28